MLSALKCTTINGMTQHVGRNFRSEELLQLFLVETLDEARHYLLQGWPEQLLD